MENWICAVLLFVGFIVLMTILSAPNLRTHSRVKAKGLKWWLVRFGKTFCSWPVYPVCLAIEGRHCRAVTSLVIWLLVSLVLAMVVAPAIATSDTLAALIWVFAAAIGITIVWFFAVGFYVWLTRSKKVSESVLFL